jgi:lysophospholipase L1-like esterase
MKRLFSLTMTAALATGLFAGAAAAQLAPAEETRLGDMRLRDFAAKWMAQQEDLIDLARYRSANRALIASTDARPRVVMMGDSITFHWTPEDLPAPAALNMVNRGIAGQTTSQMLLRFEDDVVALKPAAVVILGGTNDLRAYQGEPAAAGDQMLDLIARNLTAMADIAQARGIKVVLCAVPPIGTNQRQRDPATIRRVNGWIKAFAASRNYPFVDYNTALAGPGGDLPATLTADGLHPNTEGHRLMWPRLEAALVELKLTARLR